LSNEFCVQYEKKERKIFFIKTFHARKKFLTSNGLGLQYILKKKEKHSLSKKTIHAKKNGGVGNTKEG